jgi:sialate O-acetylesterase
MLLKKAKNRLLTRAARNVVVLCLSVSAHAAVQLPALLTDHMVLQRNQPIHIWGKAAAGEAVSVSFREGHASGTADRMGEWSLYLRASEAGGPFEVTIEGTNTIHLKDVLVGDVWVASGQSNMEFALREGINHAQEIAGASYPNMRLFHVQNHVSGYPLDDVEAKPWAPCSPETAAGFSAVAYFFGRDIQGRLNIPVGLIESNWGGTPADAWTSLHALSSDAALMPVFAEWARMTDALGRDKRKRGQQLEAYEKAVVEAKANGKPAPSFPWAGNDSGEWEPASLYNAMIAPLTPFPIRGVIWYQGESNASRERAPLYNHLFETMIQDWRRAWRVGDFPFLFVQLANYKTSPDSWWPALRDAQLHTLELANTGMAVTIDIGDADNIHPKNKQDVGHRLALAARAIAYGEKVEYSGPIPRTVTPDGDGLRVWFDHVGTGLQTKGAELRGFEIAGADRVFHPADARIDGNTVVLKGAGVATPVFARYAWKDNPDGNLYNVENLPASPFQSR